MKIVVILIIAILGVYVYLTYFKDLKNPFSSEKLKAVGNGQHGTAHWGTRKDLQKAFTAVEYRPDLWRQGINLPTAEGLIIHCEDVYGYHEMGPEPTETDFKTKLLNFSKGFIENKIQQITGKNSDIPREVNGEKPIYAYVDTNDVHALMIGAAGIGKTAFFLYPNIEYCCAVGMSFITTDTKGDLYANTGTIAEKYYGYDVKVIDLRHPLQSSGYNMLYQINKNMHKYLKALDEGSNKADAYYAKAEKGAKIVAKSIVLSGMKPSDMGPNSFFYESAEGIVTAIILLLSRYGYSGKNPETGEYETEKHIVSVFRLIQDLMEKTPSGDENGLDEIKLKTLLDFVREDDRASMYAASALESADETSRSVMSTAMSKLLSFLDLEMEQIFCFKNELDAESFTKKKTAVYIVMPEEDPSKFFCGSLIIQQLYQELLVIASNNKKHPNVLDKRVMFYCDEIGTMPKIEGIEAMFSAARSRKISIVAIVQLLDQFERTYGKESAKIIADNCQLTIFGGFAPTSEMAKTLSAALGKQTVESESITYKKQGMIKALDKKESYSKNMIERPLMTEDELKSIPKGNFVVMKTGQPPFRTRMKLFLRWGITFEEPYSISEHLSRKALYIDTDDLWDRILGDNPDAERIAMEKGMATENEFDDEIEGDEQVEQDEYDEGDDPNSFIDELDGVDESDNYVPHKIV